MYKFMLMLSLWYYNFSFKDFIVFYLKSSVKVISILSLFVYFTTDEYSVDRYYLADGNGNVVIYQGMVHYATGDYYERVNQFISNKKDNGFKHLYELVTNANDGSKQKLDEKIFSMMPDLSNTTLKSQGNYFDMDDDDIRADVNSQELANAIGYKYNKISINRLFNINQEELTSSIAPYSIAMGLNIADFLNNKHFILVDHFTEGDLYYGIIEYRNQVLLEKTIEQIEKGNNKIVISYGNAHYQDFFERLQKHGFYEYKHEKVVAVKNF